MGEPVQSGVVMLAAELVLRLGVVIGLFLGQLPRLSMSLFLRLFLGLALGFERVVIAGLRV